MDPTSARKDNIVVVPARTKAVGRSATLPSKRVHGFQVTRPRKDDRQGDLRSRRPA